MRLSKRSSVAVWLAAAGIALAVVWDRWAWADVSLWSGDVSVMMALARQHEFALGMLTSRLTPNPAGLVLLIAFLMRLGNLRVASMVLSVSQAAGSWWLARGLTRSRTAALVLAQPLLWSVHLRDVSTDAWAQFLLATTNLFAVAPLVMDLRRPRARNAALSMAAACAGASAYLPGIVPLAVVSLLWIVRLARRPRAAALRHIAFGLAPVIVLALVCVVPYLLALDPAQFSRPGRSAARLIVHSAFQAVLAFPAMVRYLMTFFPRPLRPEMPAALRGTSVVLAALALAIVALSRARRRIDIPLTAVAFTAAFVVGIFMLTPLLTGFVLTRDDRPDLLTQMVPALLAVAFGGGLLGSRPLAAASAVLALSFASTQAVAGIEVRRAIVSGETHQLVADLHEIRTVVGRLAAASGAPGPIAVEYDLNWDWFTEFVRLHRLRYHVRMTGSEAFDYELAHRTGLWNVCADRCDPSHDHFVVSLTDRPPHTSASSVVSTDLVGRFRVQAIHGQP